MYVLSQLLTVQQKTLWKFSIGQKKMASSATDMEVGVIREGKVITMANVTDMAKFQEIMTSGEMQTWDTKYNCVDAVYSLDQQ